MEFFQRISVEIAIEGPQEETEQSDAWNNLF